MIDLSPSAKDNDRHNRSISVNTSVRAFFHERVQRAAGNQQLDATDDALCYLVNLLTAFSASRAFFDRTENGLTLKPLAGLYAEAVSAGSADERRAALRRLGDLALFVSGVFADSLNRKPVDVDYYIAMGGNAYGCLSELSHTGALFEELARNFVAFVDLLDEASEQAPFRAASASDRLRQYELWLRTGSARAAARLRRLGLEPQAGAVSLSRH